ncbi:MAG TPA: hypothetical protein VE964_01835 [Myxococcales bacterium]|nr:hypothetical protein [Myxococcales bacterium]
MRALLLVAAAGCTTTHVVPQPLTSAEVSGLNELVWDREVELRLAGQEVRGRDLTLGSEVVWTDGEGQRQRAPLQALQSLRFSPAYGSGRGALEGAGIGLLGGGLLGAAIGFASGDDTCPPRGLCVIHFSGAQKAAFLAIGFGALGLVAGSLVGAVIGHREQVDFASSR